MVSYVIDRIRFIGRDKKNREMPIISERVFPCQYCIKNATCVTHLTGNGNCDFISHMKTMLDNASLLVSGREMILSVYIKNTVKNINEFQSIFGMARKKFEQARR